MSAEAIIGLVFSIGSIVFLTGMNLQKLSRIEKLIDRLPCLKPHCPEVK